MTSNLNKVILIGNVGKDPEIRTTQNGKELATIVLATSDSWKDKNTGEKMERTEWHRIVAFSEGLVNVIKNYVKKGSKLYVEGSLQTRKWTDSNNQEKFSTEIVLQGFTSNIIMLNNKSQTSPTSLSESKNDSIATETLDDEIPF